MGRREAEHETQTTPADRPQDFPATGRRAVKPGPPPPAGWRQPWDGGKRNMKPRPPLLRRKRRLWTFLVRPGRSRFQPAPKTARQGRPRFQPAPKTARHGWPGFQPTPKTARQGRPRFQPAPKTARPGRPGFHAKLLEQRSGRGPTQRPHSAARSARAPWTHHPACPLPLRPIALWCRRSMKCHTHPECTRLSPLTEPPARVRGALRSGDSRDCSTPPQEA